MATTAELELGIDVAALYAAHAGRVQQFVRAGVRAPEPVIEDACSFAWSRLVLHRGRIRGETASAWLVKTAIHEALKLLRREGREASLDELAEHIRRGGAPATPSLEDVVGRRARLATVGSLSERQQRLVWLQAFGFSYAEMAEQTGDTPRTIERQMMRARRKLAEAEAEAGGPET